MKKNTEKILKKIYLLSILFFLIPFLKANQITSTNSKIKENSKVKKAILLVTFGTSYNQSANVYKKIDILTKEQFQDYSVFWAYTSEKIREKLRKEGIMIDSPEDALIKLKKQNYDIVFIQSLHVIPGQEFDELSKIADKFKSEFNTIKVSPPLLNSMKDLESTAKILISKLPTERNKTDAVLFMGHGSPEHHSDLIYVAFAHVLQEHDKNIFIACVEGNPNFQKTINEIKNKQFKRVFLIPFMTVAGDHVKNDMAGDDENSWKNHIVKTGIEPIPILKGIAEYEEIINLWLEHLKKTISQEN